MRFRIAALLAVVALACAAPQESPSVQPTPRLVRIPPPGVIGPRVVVDTESEFLTTDPAVWYVLTYTGGHQYEKLHLEWRNPAGAVAQENDYIQPREANQIRVNFHLLIAGSSAASAPGEWRAILSSNGQSLATNQFKISVPPESAVNLANRTVMPQGTLAVPYSLQLSARGGAPPYRWTALKGLPPGLRVSESGIVSGAPQRRGTFGVVLEVRDSAGNSVTRTVGLPIGTAANGEVRADPRNLLRAAAPDGCAQSTPVNDFSTADSTVVLATSLEAPPGREGRVEWLDPRGEVVQVNHIAKTGGRQECLVRALALAGHKPAQLPGDWRVRLFWADSEVFTLHFTVNAAHAAAAPVRAGRIALLISNQGYEKLPAGHLAASDSDALANALRQDGFDVIRVADANLEGLRQIEQTLEGKLQSGDTAFIYYAGDSARAAGDEWLLPVNFDPADRRPMQTRAYSAIRLLQWLEDSKAALRFVVLDSAVPEGQPNENPGELLAEVDESTALIYSRSSSPGALAKALADAISKPDADARTLLGIDLPKAAGRGAAPMAIIGGGADFVFRQTAR